MYSFFYTAAMPHISLELFSMKIIDLMRREATQNNDQREKCGE